jgi:hypothetical protein
MILNTGMRTDIPAYFSEWFYNRIKEGSVCTRNPYYPEQVTRFKLDPELIDCLCFCTKNPRPMLSGLSQIDSFLQFWFVTLTPYGKEIEPNVPEVCEVIGSIRTLSDKVGKRAVGWRYDPIFITEKYDLDFHIKSFGEIAEKLSGKVESCVISFIDLYAKTRRNFPEARAVTREERAVIGEAFAEIGKKNGVEIRSCCEGTDLVRFGIDARGCMTQEILEHAIGMKLDMPKKKMAARAECGCLLGNDIGMYNTCPHGCVYCYANYDSETVKKNCALHDPASPFLIGGAREGDIVHDAVQKAWRDGQMSLFAL